MTRVVLQPPELPLLSDGARLGGWWHEEAGSDRITCDLCPRECSLKPGDKGFCFVRENRDGEMVLNTYGRSTGFCIDPIEKKPLNHFLPGTAVLSFGTAGCNLGCKFCQNWDISKSREVKRLSDSATPESIAEAARQHNCSSVAYTYNDPIIWAEYAIDVARACREVGVKSVAVTAGYISPAARGPFFREMDAANVDLKAFTEEFYWRLTQSHIQPVLDTLHWLKHETDVWFEITNLIIPDANDSPDELRQMCDWILEHVGDEVPVHFTAFHPDFRMTDRDRTPHQKLMEAYDLALSTGIKYVYVGNVNDVQRQSTYCPGCRTQLIQRDWHQLGQYQMNGNRCAKCNEKIAGVFEQSPGTWGRKRQPVQIADFQRELPVVNSAMPTNSNSSQFVQIQPAPRTNPQRVNTMSTTGQPNLQELSDEQKKSVHDFANTTMAAAITGRNLDFADATLAGVGDIQVLGAFVTLKRNGNLRACCGFLSLEKTTPAIEAIRHAAVRTATEDHRFPPISTIELEHLTVNVQLLFGTQVVQQKGADRINAVEAGRHGLQIRMGDKGGLLLPMVATEQGYNSEQFLQQVCLKAGLPTTAWRDDNAQLLTFEGNSIPGDFDGQLIADLEIKKQLYTDEQMGQLAEHCRNSFIAMLQGNSTPAVLAGIPEANVPGLIVDIELPGQEPVNFANIAMRQSFPLQASLTKVLQSSANNLRSKFDPNTASQIQVHITAMFDPGMHATVGAPELDGFDSSWRGVVTMEGKKSGMIFNPQKSPQELVDELRERTRITRPEFSPLISIGVQSSRPTVSFINDGPPPQQGNEIRHPAVAGSFYPGKSSELAALVDGMLGEVPAEKQSWPAVMVPHAGLKFSGQIAADVLKKVDIPASVIIIGPKHTSNGVDWAVAPHKLWRMPGGDIPSDPEFAEKLSQNIDGLKLDSAAHFGEHSIELELPFVARLAPNAKVVGITLGGGSFEQCQKFAAQLGAVIAQLNPKPLLVISSDMNHFATDEENRRLDEMALAAMETLDAKKLYDVCQQNRISMCGMLPAVVIMETLRQTSGLAKMERAGYSTSADVTGDKSRVVGYAGMMLG
jgi:AmmeMemoRadiSam system radical SAM enzyme/AmmeMemoRadiSam system protein B/AmmeMemoRadiSam system protein A